ncbi:MAG: FAD-dependent oxidoreductase [Fimbriimonadaceae bacterium]|nr:MAG: FAD-dependent oxidoreductase [Fimbriimonadaceae bacterium]
MKIGVVGAGIAGLRTAMLLEKAGHQVTVFEARDRVGGRMQTVEMGDGYYEAGGEWIDADHHRVIRLLREFGVAPEKSSQWPGLVVYQGEFATENQIWPDAALDADLVHEAAEALITKQRRGEDIGEDQPLGAWLDSICKSERGRWWVEAFTRSDEGEDTSQVSLLGWLESYAHYLDREDGVMSLYRITGGGGKLCERMAAKLQDLRLNSPIQHVSDQGEVIDKNGSTHLFDRVVFALPAGCLEKVLDVESQISLKPQEGSFVSYDLSWVFHLPSVKMARSVKLVLQFKNAWWRDKNWSGRMLGDLAFQQTWEIGRGNLNALGVYVCGAEAIQLMEQPNPVDVVLKSITQVHPEARESFISGAVHDWVSDEFAGGAFPYYPVKCAPSMDKPLPNPSPDLGRESKINSTRFKPYGRIHFAGDWACDWMGFIEGALESAERVVEEIKNAGE